MTTLVHHHVGRFHVHLPASAELSDFSLEVDGVDCGELDVGDPTPTGGELAWYQLTDEMRTRSDFAESIDPALYSGETSEEFRVLRQLGERGLELSGPAKLRDTAQDIAATYLDGSQRTRDSLGLRWGALDIPQARVEDLTANFRGRGWELELGSCPLSATADSNFEDLRPLLVNEGYDVEIGSLSLHGVPGDFIVFSRPVEYTATWRSLGSPGAKDEPELEVTFTSSLPAEDAAAVWSLIRDQLQFLKPSPP